MGKIKLEEFKIKNVNNLNNTGWIKCNDVTTIVGGNKEINSSVLRALWLLNPNFKDTKYINEIIGRKDMDSDEIFITVKYKVTEEIVKIISTSINIDKEFIKDTIEISKKISGEYIITNFLKYNQMTKCILNDWINENNSKNNKDILNIIRRCLKDINKVDENDRKFYLKVKKYLDEIDKINVSPKKKTRLTKLRSSILNEYELQKKDQDLLIESMPKYILYTQQNYKVKKAANQASLKKRGKAIISCRKECVKKENTYKFYELRKKIDDGYFKKTKTNTIILMDNFEEKCNCNEQVDFIEFCSNNFINIQIIHTTKPPFLVKEMNKNSEIINTEKAFRKEKIKDNDNNQHKSFITAMGIGAFLWILVTIFLNVYIFSQQTVQSTQKNFIGDVNYIWAIIKQILFSQGLIGILIIVILLGLLFLKKRVKKNEVINKIFDFSGGMLTGHLMIPLMFIVNIFPIIFSIIVVLSSFMTTVFLAILISELVANLFMFVFFETLEIFIVPEVSRNIIQIEPLLNNDEINLFISLIILFSIIPYSTQLITRLLEWFFGFINKSLIESSYNFVKKLLNVNFIRGAIYFIGFILSLVYNVFEIKGNNYLQIVMNSILLFITLDVIFNSIYNSITKLKVKKENKRRLELIRVFKSTFNDDLYNKNKFEIVETLKNMECSDKVKVYFTESSLKNPWKKESIRSDKKYFSTLFWRYNRLKNISVMVEEDYINNLKEFENYLDECSITLLA